VHTIIYLDCLFAMKSLIAFLSVRGDNFSSFPRTDVSVSFEIVGVFICLFFPVSVMPGYMAVLCFVLKVRLVVG